MTTESLPFDQYQRYRMVAELLEDWVTDRDPTPTVLDVGGFARRPDGRPFQPLTEFLPVEVWTYDVVESDMDNYVCIEPDPEKIPARDFDVVIMCDVLEHVPPTGRRLLVERVLDIARHVAIVAGPFADPLVSSSEAIVNQYHRSLTGADFSWLAEHREHGLPSLDDLCGMLQERELPFEVVHSGYVHRWVVMMLARLHIQTQSESVELLARLHEYYNRNYYEDDQRQPGYRKVVVVPTSAQGAPVLKAAVALRKRADALPPADPGNASLLVQAFLASRLDMAEVLVNGRLHAAKTVGPIFGDGNVSFEVSCPVNDVSRIDLYLATYGRRLMSPLHVRLEDAEQPDDWSHEAVLPGETLQDNYWHRVRFPSRADSGGRQLRVTLRAPDAPEQAPFTVYTDADDEPLYRLYALRATAGEARFREQLQRDRDLREQIARMEAALREREGTLQDQGQALTRVLERLAHIEERLEHREKELTIARERAELLRRKLHEARRQMEHRRLELFDTRSQAEEYEQELDAARSEISELRERLAHDARQLLEVRKQLDSQRQDHRGHLADLARLISEKTQP